MATRGPTRRWSLNYPKIFQNRCLYCGRVIPDGFKGHPLNKEAREKSLQTKRKNGYNFSNEHRRKIGLGNIGKKHTKESIEKIKEARSKQILPLKDTSIEVKVQNLLKQLGITFYTHQYIQEIEHGYQCDILIPVQNGINRKTIIECFGNYWHNYPYGKEIDTIRTQELIKAGYRVIVFWENEIKVMELNDLEMKI